ncbi:MAG: hypothetical protein KGQ59_12650 [Bdellovibrionales bacterium]|nr:hypothetical protein [Bdellovibrionales bacterium]
MSVFLRAGFLFLGMSLSVPLSRAAAPTSDKPIIDTCCFCLTGEGILDASNVLKGNLSGKAYSGRELCNSKFEKNGRCNFQAEVKAELVVEGAQELASVQQQIMPAFEEWQKQDQTARAKLIQLQLMSDDERKKFVLEQQGKESPAFFKFIELAERERALVDSVDRSFQKAWKDPEMALHFPNLALQLRKQLMPLGQIQCRKVDIFAIHHGFEGMAEFPAGVAQEFFQRFRPKELCFDSASCLNANRIQEFTEACQRRLGPVSDQCKFSISGNQNVGQGEIVERSCGGHQYEAVKAYEPASSLTRLTVEVNDLVVKQIFHPCHKKGARCGVDTFVDQKEPGNDLSSWYCRPGLGNTHVLQKCCELSLDQTNQLIDRQQSEPNRTEMKKIVAEMKRQADQARGKPRDGSSSTFLGLWAEPGKDCK